MSQLRHRPSLLLLLVALGSPECRASSEPARVELVARAPERGNWEPREIRLARGQPVTLVIRNVDVVSHGFYVPALNLLVSDIRAGDVREIQFTPQQAGEFPFYCSVWCGDYHMDMRGKLIVR